MTRPLKWTRVTLGLLSDDIFSYIVARTVKFSAVKSIRLNDMVTLEVFLRPNLKKTIFSG